MDGEGLPRDGSEACQLTVEFGSGKAQKTWWAALRACSQLAVRGAEEKMEKDQHKRGGRKEQANINVGTLTACFQSKVIEGHYSTHRRLTILSESHEFTTDTHTPKKMLDTVNVL